METDARAKAAEQARLTARAGSFAACGGLFSVHAEGEEPLFRSGDDVKIALRFPIGHYRVPTYIRGKRGRVEAVIEPRAVNDDEEGFGRNAGLKRHYYRLAFPLTELWPKYAGSPHDGLRIEVFETWLERS